MAADGEIGVVDVSRPYDLIIAGGGALLGIALGVGGNIALASTLSLTRMSTAFICGGAALLLGLSQLAVLWPALRAASIPPAMATRQRESAVSARAAARQASPSSFRAAAACSRGTIRRTPPKPPSMPTPTPTTVAGIPAASKVILARSASRVVG